MNDNWSASTHWEVICRRAGGRRAYNSLRQFRAVHRRKKLLELLASGRYGNLYNHGTQARLAKALGVHRSTVCRDIQALLQQTRENGKCPLCGHEVGPESVEYAG